MKGADRANHKINRITCYIYIMQIFLYLTAGGIRLLENGHDVGYSRLLLSLVQNIVPVGSQERAPVKVDCNNVKDDK